MRQVHIRSPFEMCQIPVRCKWAVEESRIRNGICHTGVDKRRKYAEVSVKPVVPIKRCVSCAQAFFGVTRWAGSHQRGSVIHQRLFPARVQHHKCVTDAIRRHRAASWRSGAVEIDWDPDSSAEMLAEAISSGGTQRHHLPVRIRTPFKILVKYKSLLLSGRVR